MKKLTFIVHTSHTLMWLLVIERLQRQPFANCLETKLTNVLCESKNDSLMRFHECSLKMIRRGVPAFTMRSENHLPATNNLKVNLSFKRRRNNSFIPYLYNVTFNFCKFMLEQDSVPVAKLLYAEMAPYTNINHTCPYTHDLIVEKMTLQSIYLKLLPVPVPAGDYMMIISIAVDNVPLITLTMYGQLS